MEIMGEASKGEGGIWELSVTFINFSVNLKLL